jgi:hypothetical protein
VKGWADASVWLGEGLRRENFFFGWGGERLFGSLYRAESLSRRDGLIVCPSWGIEADRSNRLLNGLAVAMARLGGAALTFHYPGYGDSEGDVRALTVDALAEAAVTALTQADRRVPDIEWTLAGFTFGASIACLVLRCELARGLLLLQPELRPGFYFEELVRKTKRSGFGKDLERLAFGYPVPASMLDRAGEADAAVERAISTYDKGGLAAHYASPAEPKLLPASLERRVVPGTWRFGARHQRELSGAAIEWLEARVPQQAAGGAFG